MPASGQARWLAGLARDVGVHHQDRGLVGAARRGSGVQQMSRLVRLVVLASSVFDEVGFGRDGLGNLRRLVDLVRAARGGEAEVTLADLQAEYRLLHGLGGDVMVSMRDL